MIEITDILQLKQILEREELSNEEMLLLKHDIDCKMEKGVAERLGSMEKKLDTVLIQTTTLVELMKTQQSSLATLIQQNQTQQRSLTTLIQQNNELLSDNRAVLRYAVLAPALELPRWTTPNGIVDFRQVYRNVQRR